jgi:uncharacterized membrane protein
MTITNRQAVAAILIAALLLFPLVVFTSGAARIVPGLCLVLFFPGYTLIAALFPRRGGLGPIERVALSFGISIAVVPLIGLVLNYTPWGIRLYPVLTAVTAFILACAGAALYRDKRLPPEERLRLTVRFAPPKWSGMSPLDRAVSVGLVVAIAAAIGTLVFTVVSPKEGEKFTEFYILGPGGKAEDYPTELTVSEEGRVIVGVVNHENECLGYRVELWAGNMKQRTVQTGVLAEEEKWEREVSFSLDGAGANQKVEFWLFVEGKEEPHLEDPLHLWVDVGG